MALSIYCEQSPPAWRGKYADGFLIYDKAVKKTVFRYSIPYEDDRDAILQTSYSLTSEDRLKYYQSLVQGIQRNKAITGLLKANQVPSILGCELIEQEKDQKTGRNCIYLLTEEVRPIEQVFFVSEINLLTLLDIFIRLQIIIRDIAKAPHCVTHHGISLDEVYFNADGKILLGGFYYATSPKVPGTIPFLPDYPKHLSTDLTPGANDHAGRDMQQLTKMLYNILSGLPWDTQWDTLPRVAPAFAPNELADILMVGLNCTEADCNYFRRRLLNFRKDISKTELSTMMVPICKPIRKEFVYE